MENMVEHGHTLVGKISRPRSQLRGEGENGQAIARDPFCYRDRFVAARDFFILRDIEAVERHCCLGFQSRLLASR